jgi:hypothetical protein
VIPRGAVEESMKRNHLFLILFTAAVMLALAGCAAPEADKAEEHSAEAVGEHGADHEVQPLAAAEITEAMQAKLEAADRADGEADRTIKLCASCALSMEGNPQHALQAGDYTMHFCSEHCREAFGEDLAGSLQALAVPEAEAEEATP